MKLFARRSKPGPQKGQRVTSIDQQRSRYWLTAKGYRALGRDAPPPVLETDRELGLEPRE